MTSLPGRCAAEAAGCEGPGLPRPPRCQGSAFTTAPCAPPGPPRPRGSPPWPRRIPVTQHSPAARGDAEKARGGGCGGGGRAGGPIRCGPAQGHPRPPGAALPALTILSPRRAHSHFRRRRCSLPLRHRRVPARGAGPRGVMRAGRKRGGKRGWSARGGVGAEAVVSWL